MTQGAIDATPFGVIERVLGFRAEPTRRGDVEDAVHERLRRRGRIDLATYAALLEDATARAVEARALADRLTVNETYFFRESQHHDALRDDVVPAIVARAELPLRVLSLGCSSGEEPYGVALTLLEAGLGPESASITACDASPAMIAKAERALYSEWSLRNVPDSVRARYFRCTRAGFELDPRVRAWVRFEVRNVVEEDPTFWRPARFDVVLCRNMLIYLTPAVTRRVIERIALSLRPGGHLLLGHSETAHAGPRFAVVHSHGAFYFRRRASDAPAPVPSASPAAPPTHSERIAVSSDSGPSDAAPPEPPPIPPAPALPGDVAALALFRIERFEDALAAIADAPPSTDVALLRAAILTNLGKLREAEEACDACLLLDATCAGAHYLFGLCREHAGDVGAARERYARASELDRALAMSRLRGGILARRARERDAARLLLREALRALPEQGDHTFALFGGSFSRESWMSVCRAEIAKCEADR